MNHLIGRRAYLAAVSAAGVGALAGCAKLASFGGETTEGWTTFRGDPGNTGVRSADAGPGSSLSLAWELTWTDVLSDLEDEDPDDVEPIYSASTAGGTEPDDDDDDLLTPHIEFSDPVLAASTVVCSVGYRWYDPATETESERTRVIAVDQSDGEILWSHPLKDRQTTQTEELDPNIVFRDHLTWFGAEIVDGRVTVPVADDAGVDVVVLDEESGDVVDELDLGLPENCGRPRLADGLLYVIDTAESMQLRAFDLDTGSEEWSRALELVLDTTPPGRSSISIDGDRVWTVEGDGDSTEVVARDSRDGTEQLREPIALPDHDVAPTLGALAFGPEYAYAAGDHYAVAMRTPTPLVSIDPADGTERWRYEPPPVKTDAGPVSGIYGYPIVVEGRVIAAGIGAPSDGDSSHARHLFAVNDRDGTLEWSLELDVPNHAPVAAGETVYLDGPTPRAISVDGEPQETLDHRQSAPIRSTMALGNGRLFVGDIARLLAVE